MPNPNNKNFIWHDPEYLSMRTRGLDLMTERSREIARQLNISGPGSVSKEKGLASRAIRALGSEPYAIFGNQLEEGLSSGNGAYLVDLMAKAEGAQRKNWQPVPGLHGHHKFAINSTWDPMAFMAPDQQVEGLKILTNRGYHLGNRGDKFEWLSGPAHIEGWSGRNDVFAHQAASGQGLDTKRFTIGALNPLTTGQEYADAVEPQILGQLKVNRQALTQPNEIQVRNAIAAWQQRLSIPEVFDLENLDQVKANNKAFKNAGFNATSFAREAGQYDWAKRLMPGGSSALANEFLRHASYSSILDPETRSAFKKGDAVGTATAAARDVVVGGAIQAALPHLLKIGTPAAVAASLGGSQDSRIRDRRLQAALSKMSTTKRRNALIQITKDKQAAAKPLVDGDALLKKINNEARYLWGQFNRAVSRMTRPQGQV